MKLHRPAPRSRAPQPIAMSARDLSKALGLGLKTARHVAKKLGRRIGNRYVVSTGAVIRWLEKTTERRG